MRKSGIIFFGLALAAALLLSACGSTPPIASPSSPESSGVAESASEPPAAPENGGEQAADGIVSVTDQAGRTVIIEEPVERIVSGYYISSSACIALGLEDKLAGIEAKADSRPIYALAAPRLLELPNVGTAKEFDLEGCVALEPDLVILPLRLRDSADTMAELGIPVLLVNPESHQGLVEMLALIGEAAGVQERADSLIRYYSEELAAVAGLTKDLTEKPSVYMGGNSAYLTAAPGAMYQSTLIGAGGGVNAAAGLEGDSWADVSYEQLLAMDPDVIVIPPEAAYSREDILADAQLAALTAVKEGRVFQMPRDFEAWDSPVPSCTLGAKWMLSVLHEDVYPMESLRADTAAFYREFYSAEIDPALIGK